MHAAIQAAPTPFFGPGHQSGPQRVAFHVAEDGQQMFVGGDGKALEATLIDVAHARRAVVRVPALRMRDREPAKEFGNLLVLPLPGPDHKVPMVAHQRVAEDPQRHTLEGLGEHLLEGGEIGLLLEQSQPSIGSIEHMVRITTHDGASTPRHGGRCYHPAPSQVKK